MYRGRFAPSPSGPLHFGSLVTAVASYLDARANRGAWLVRIEDLDRPRTVAGADQTILHALAAFGFEWDGTMVYQSRRDALYQQAFERLRAAALVYPCACSRREIADSASHGPAGAVYPGTCRHGLPPGRRAQSWRIVTDDTPHAFDDAVQGQVSQVLARDVGDFVLRRADGLFAYQLAVVVDDAEQGITHVVRGADLLDSTPRQIYLQRRLQLPAVRYAHVPVVVNANAEKLSKQTRAQPIDARRAVLQLWQALDFLGQQPPADLRQVQLDALWRWAVDHWRRDRIPALRQRHYPL